MADIQILRSGGIDINEGLACCADDAEFYEEMLAEYITESKTGEEELDRFYTQQDWVRYGIRAHSVKSTSRMIGATSFSEIAREMEFAAKEGRFDEIIARHDAFTGEYRRLADCIREALI